MSPKISFYILSDSQTTQARFNLACRLIEKAYEQEKTVYIHLANQTEVNELDSLLWTYRDTSFIPHSTLEDISIPILLGHSAEQTFQNGRRDILINLSEDVPTFYNKFERVLEIVANQTQDEARKRYRFYRDQSLELETHKL